MPLIVVHGETLVEPVAPGTNRAAIEADIDILAHPGLITVEEAARARERGVFLELSARKATAWRSATWPARPWKWGRRCW